MQRRALVAEVEVSAASGGAAYLDAVAQAPVVDGHKRGSLRLNQLAMTVARELLASGDRRSIVLADLIIGFVREEVRTMERAEVEAETGWGKTFWFSEIGKAVADSWAEGHRTGQAKGLAKGKAEGKAEGLAEALWLVLRARQLAPTKRQRARIEACRNRKQLERWLQKALLANDVAEIIGR